MKAKSLLVWKLLPKLKFFSTQQTWTPTLGLWHKLPGHSSRLNKNSGSIPRNACAVCKTWLCVTTKKVRLPDRQTDKVIPMCWYASQATQQVISILTVLWLYIFNIDQLYRLIFIWHHSMQISQIDWKLTFLLTKWLMSDAFFWKTKLKFYKTLITRFWYLSATLPLFWRSNITEHHFTMEFNMFSLILTGDSNFNFNSMPPSLIVSASSAFLIINN